MFYIKSDVSKWTFYFILKSTYSIHFVDNVEDSDDTITTTDGELVSTVAEVA